MKTPEISDIVKSLTEAGLPVAYRQFLPIKGRDVPSPPYAVYIISPEIGRGADYKNLLIERHVRLEVYTDAKDTALEAAVEKILGAVEWEKDEDYIESEELYMVTYDFEIYEKIRKDIENA